MFDQFDSLDSLLDAVDGEPRQRARHLTIRLKLRLKDFKSSLNAVIKRTDRSVVVPILGFIESGFELFGFKL